MKFDIKSYIAPFLFAVLLLVYQIAINGGFRYAFVTDALVKAVQIVSLAENHRTNESIIYLAEDIDPNHELNPFPLGFSFKNKDRFIGNYPVAFSFIYSYFASLGVNTLTSFNFIFLLTILILLKTALKFSNLTLFQFSFGTLLYTQLLDLSEYPLFYLLMTVSFIYFVKYLTEPRIQNLLWACVFSGMAVWFRLEALVFAFSFFAPILLLELMKKDFSRMPSIFGAGLFFLFVISVFFIFNHIDYGIFLGPRFILNYSLQATPTFIERILRFLTITFTTVRYGYPSLGFFFYSPILLLLLCVSIFQWKKLSYSSKIMSLASILLILLVGFTAPSDGATITGRYLSLLAFPLCFLFHENLDDLLKSKANKIAYRAFAIWTCILAIVIFLIALSATRQFKKYERIVAQAKYKTVFLSTELVAASTGLNYFEKKVMLVKDENGYKTFKTLLSQEREEMANFSLFGPSEKLVEQIVLAILLDKFLLMKIESERNGYLCTDIQTHGEIRQTDCVKRQKH